MRTEVVKDEDGNTCNTPEMQQQRWRRHFTKILNLQSEFSVEELDKVRQRPLKPAMAEIPSEEELQSALGKLKSGKAGGESGILSEGSLLGGRVHEAAARAGEGCMEGEESSCRLVLHSLALHQPKF